MIKILLLVLCLIIPAYSHASQEMLASIAGRVYCSYVADSSPFDAIGSGSTVVRMEVRGQGGSDDGEYWTGSAWTVTATTLTNSNLTFYRGGLWYVSVTPSSDMTGITVNCFTSDSSGIPYDYAENVYPANRFNDNTDYVRIVDGTGTGEINTANGNVSLAVTPPTAAQNAAAVWQDTTAGDFSVASSIGKALYINDIAPGGSGGHMISGTNAGTTTLGALTVTGTTTMSDGLVVNRSTANQPGVSITGNGSGVGLYVTSGSNSAALFYGGTDGSGIAATGRGSGSGFIADKTGTGYKISGDIQGNLSGSVGSVTGAVGSVTGAVGSVTGNVGGNVTGSVGSLATQAKADVNAEASAALVAIDLDHLVKNGTDVPWPPATNSYLATLYGDHMTISSNLTAINNIVDLIVAYLCNGSGTCNAPTNTGLWDRLDAAVTSRMATYTQPTGFLAATFPTTVASPTNITGGTITNVGTVTGNVNGSVASVTNMVTANVTQVSGNATSADNLELAYDGTGYGGGGIAIVIDSTNTSTALAMVVDAASAGVITVDNQYVGMTLYCGTRKEGRQIVATDDNTTDTISVEPGNPFNVAPGTGGDETCYIE